MSDLPATERETIMLRFKGGLLDGETIASTTPWPPPDRIDGSTEPFLYGEPGYYAKIRQSQLTEPVPAFLARGAEYEWRDAE